MDEHVVKRKEDIGKLSERTRSLRVNCKLDYNDTVEIMRKCRLLQEVVFDEHAFHKTEDNAKEYLNKWVFIDVERRAF